MIIKYTPIPASNITNQPDIIIHSNQFANGSDGIENAIEYT